MHFLGAKIATSLRKIARYGDWTKPALVVQRYFLFSQLTT